MRRSWADFKKGVVQAGQVSPGHIYKDLPEASGEGAMPREKELKAGALGGA